MRGRIVDSGLSQVRARRIVADLDDAKPWDSTSSYIGALAALAALHPDEMRRKTGLQSRTVGNVCNGSLMAAVSGGRSIRECSRCLGQVPRPTSHCTRKLTVGSRINRRCFPPLWDCSCPFATWASSLPITPQCIALHCGR